MCYVNDEPEALDEIAEMKEGIDENLESIEASGIFTDDDVAEMQTSVTEYYATLDEVVSAVDDGTQSDIDGAVEEMDEATFELNDQLIGYVGEAKENLEANIADLHDMIGLVNTSLLASLVAVVAFGAVFSFLFSRSLLGPVARMTAAANDISSGKKDVQFLNIERDDEIGELGKSFDRMTNSLKVAMDMLEKEGKV